MMSTSQRSTKTEIAESSIPVRNIWHMLLYALRSWHLHKLWKVEVENSPGINYLIIHILNNLMQQRMRIGLDRDYIRIEKEIVGIRGRVDFNKSIKKILLPKGKTVSKYNIYDKNIPKNQIVKSILIKILQKGICELSKIENKDLYVSIHKTLQKVEDIESIELNSKNILREQNLQKDADYRLMLALSYILYLQLMPTEYSGEFSLTKVDYEQFRLHDIYEKFVAEFYKYHLKNWLIKPQSRFKWPAEENKYLPELKPDILFENKKNGRIIVLDTKFTANSLNKNQYDKEIFSQSHLYQIYSYLRSQEDLSDYFRKSDGILLYPTVNNHLDEIFCMQGHRFRIVTIDLSLKWEDIENRLLGIIENC